MNKQSKDRVFYVLVFVVVFILPNFFLSYRNDRIVDTYFERAERDYQNCLIRAAETSAEKRWCDEIKSASMNSFNSSENLFDINLVVNLFLPVLFVLIITANNQKKQIEELKEKLNV